VPAPVGDSGRRLITPEEAAALLGVSGLDVLDWIDRRMISSAISEAGEPQIVLTEERVHNDGPFSGYFTRLELGRGIDPASRERFQQELQVRRRELELDGLDYGAIDVDELTNALAKRLAAVIPDGTDVSVSEGMVFVDGSGIDVAVAVARGDGPPAELIRDVAERALQIASEAISELTTDPWPAKPGQFRGGFPPANADVIDGQLCLSYGDPDHPVLKLEPIELTAVLIRS